MTPTRQQDADDQHVKTWTLPYSATLGSSVRRQGIFLEVRARLPVAARRSLTISEGRLILGMPAGSDKAFRAAAEAISETLEGIETLTVIPREIEDILGISSTERHRWLKDGRLPSAGARTVRLRGRAREVTFHVFDPRVVEDLLDRDVVAAWREEDAETAAENRRRAAWKSKLKRSRSNTTSTGAPSEAETDGRPGLQGWEEFAREGLLR